MRKLLTLMILGLLLGSMTGCRIGQCWREAWNSRFHPQPQQTVICSDPCVVSDSCASPCGTACSPCSGGGMPVITTGPTGQ
jgi:hypothetical protein